MVFKVVQSYLYVNRSTMATYCHMWSENKSVIDTGSQWIWDVCSWTDLRSSICNVRVLCKIVFVRTYFVKFPPILIIFGRKMANRLQLWPVNRKSDALLTVPLNYLSCVAQNLDVYNRTRLLAKRVVIITVFIRNYWLHVYKSELLHADVVDVTSGFRKHRLCIGQ